MKITPIFKCFNKSGEIQIPERAKEHFKSLPDIVELSVKPWRNIRSNQQNKYLWGVIYQMISEETGNAPEEVHEYCSSKWLSETREFRTKRGAESIFVVRSTTSLKTVEFMSYTDKIKQWASEFLGIYIPDPKEVEL